MATTQAVTITELKQLADKHLNNIDFSRDDRYRRIARLHPAYDDYYNLASVQVDYKAVNVDYKTVNFRAESVKVAGLECTAWFYGDILVKVAV